MRLPKKLIYCTFDRSPELCIASNSYTIFSAENPQFIPRTGDHLEFECNEITFMSKVESIHWSYKDNSVYLWLGGIQSLNKPKVDTEDGKI